MTVSELVTIETTFYSRVLTNDLDLSKNITPLFPTKEHLKKEIYVKDFFAEYIFCFFCVDDFRLQKELSVSCQFFISDS